MDFNFFNDNINDDMTDEYIENFANDFDKKYVEVDDKYKKEDNAFDMKINSDLKKEFNIKCIQNGTSMSKVLKDYIKEYIKK